MRSPATTRSRERSIFVAENGRRARRLRMAGRGAAALTLVWLAALLIAVLPFADLPDLSGRAWVADHDAGPAVDRQNPIVRSIALGDAARFAERRGAASGERLPPAAMPVADRRAHARKSIRRPNAP